MHKIGRMPRILEIGSWHYFKDIYPNTTDMLWTGDKPVPTAREKKDFSSCTPIRFLQSMRQARAGKYDIIVVYMPLRPAWHPRYWLRAFLRQPLRPFSAMLRVFGVSWLRLVNPKTPIAVFDMNDAFIVGAHNFFLLDKATIAFKRELPVDRWHILCHSAHPALPTRRIRRNVKWNARLDKIRPISLPADPIDSSLLWEGDKPHKSTDVFFVGEVAENSWLRRQGLAELEVLRSKGLKIDIPAERLPHDEFLRRLSKSWLAWSPSGYSWECYRTAEAAQCLTVPILNYPTVERHAPLRENEHMFFYEAAQNSLSETIERVLGDKTKLELMAQAARDHVRQHHLKQAMTDYALSLTLSAAATFMAKSQKEFSPTAQTPMRAAE